MSSQTFFWKKRSRIWRLRVHFLHETLFHYFWRLFLKEAFFKFLPKMLLGKTLCKLLQIFPPKVLVYIRNIFLNTIENCLRQIKWFVEYETCNLLSIYWRTIKVETETGYLTLLTCLLIVDDNTRRKRITKFSFYWQSIYF